MSKPQEPHPVRLVVGVIFSDKETARDCWLELEAEYGPLDFLSPVRDFDFTRYYEKEMGAPLFRRWGTFARLVPPDRLVEIKWRTYPLEGRFAQEGRRRINLDPGLLSAERLVLATGKNYSHRIYLGRGIYGDLTLIYARETFAALPWTYPDYSDPETIGMFNILRQRLLLQIRSEKQS